jgi:hypothetical protein
MFAVQTSTLIFGFAFDPFEGGLNNNADRRFIDGIFGEKEWSSDELRTAIADRTQGVTTGYGSKNDA